MTQLVNFERRSRATLAFVYERHREGLLPTVREIMAGAGLSSTSVVEYHLDRLYRLGYLKWTKGKARTYLLTPGGILAAQGYKLLWKAEYL